MSSPDTLEETKPTKAIGEEKVNPYDIIEKELIIDNRKPDLEASRNL